MAEKSTFFNSVNGDRKYKAEDMAAHFAKVLANGVMPSGTQLQVIENSGMNVVVSAGSAWINGYAYHNDADFILAIDPADGASNRVDRIVVRWDRLARSINLVVLKGVPASSAVAPEIVRNPDYYDLSIATIGVNAGITAITQALITDTRMDSAVCGFVSSLIQPDTSGWFAQFETAFNEWFYDIQAVLGGDVAGNLQNQINELQTQADKIKTLNGTTPPTTSTVGVVGQFYLDTATKDLYQCTVVDGGVYTWEFIEPYAIGDTVNTVRTDSRENWLLCNGALINKAVYSELYAMLVNNTYYDVEDFFTATGLQSLSKLQYVNGIFFACGTEPSGCGAIAYSNKLSASPSDWTVNNITGTTAISTIGSIAYVNGLLFAFEYNGTKMFSTPDYTGAWTTRYSAPNGFRSIAYGNGYYVAIGVYSNRLYMTYTSDLTDPLTNWTFKNVDDCQSADICFDGTSFVIVSIYNLATHVHTFTDPSGTINYTGASAGEGLFSFFSSGTTNLVDFKCENSQLTVVLKNGTDIVAGYTTNYTGQWQRVNLINHPADIYKVSKVFFVNNEYVLLYTGSSYDLWIAHGSDLVSAFIPGSLHITASNMLEATTIAWFNGNYVFNIAGGKYFSAEIFGDCKKLPTISVSGTYTYIKAK